MDGNKVVLVIAPDWQCLYVNGELKMQDERIQLQHALPVMLKNDWVRGIQFEIQEVPYEWINTTFPDQLKNLKIPTQT